MKALVLDRPGGPEILRVAEVPEPEPGPGEIRVAVSAAGLNPADYKFAAAGFRTWSYPFILGLDVAGTVDRLGPGVTEWRVGDRVYYHGDFSRSGGFAEKAIATAHTVARVPDNLSFAEAAALPCAGFTAYQALFHKLHIRPGQSILIQGAAGGVGGFAVQMAALTGLQVLGTCSPGNAQWVKRLGAVETLDYRADDLRTRVRDLTGGHGVDAVVDTAGPASAATGLELLAFGGGIACVAGLPDFSRPLASPAACSLHRIALGGAYLSGDRRAQLELARIGQECARLVAAGKINPILEEVITLEEIPSALARLAGRHVRGKIVARLAAESAA